MVQVFNASFFNRDFFQNRPEDELHLIYEDNRTPEDPLLEDAIKLCLHTDVFKSLGLTLIDLMNMDYPTYTRIAEALTRDKQEKIQQMEKTQQQFSDRSKAIDRVIKMK